MQLRLKSSKPFIFFAMAMAMAMACFAPAKLCAQATLLLEEPYRYDGTFAGTGHSAVFLSRVCAESPTVVRRCESGETGVVISRYHGIAGRDWIAVPLIPYLYAVRNPGEIPLIADTKLVSFLRHEYLRNDLRPVSQRPDGGDGVAYQLVGSAYDRTTYAFRIETRPEQDDELIRILNAVPNHDSYALLNRNCADFAKQIINFYYPKAIHRAIIADLGVMTPKQAAKSLVRFGKHHSELQLTTFIIPQVPGLKRSKPVHGVIESLVLAKKYVTPVLLFHPFVVGTVEAAYWAGWRFNPSKGALIFNPNSDPNNEDQSKGLDLPLSAEQRRAFSRSLADLRRSEPAPLPSWRSLQAGAQPQLDAAGQPSLQVQTDGMTVQVGLCRDNALRLSAPPEVIQELMFTRLEQQLKPGNPSRTSLPQMQSDWKLLEQAVEARQASLSDNP